MKSGIRISKKSLKRLVLLVVLIGAAFVLDAFLDHHPAMVEQEQTPESPSSGSQSAFILSTSGNTFSVKPNLQRTSSRLMHARLHDKFLQKHHQMKNYHTVKKEPCKEKIPLVPACFCPIYRDYFSDRSDDEPFRA
jgi:hypothetical protein